MTAMLRTARRLLADDSGATAIEYALLAALIAVVIIVGDAHLGQTLDGMFGESQLPSWSTHMPASDRTGTIWLVSVNTMRTTRSITRLTSRRLLSSIGRCGKTTCSEACKE